MLVCLCVCACVYFMNGLEYAHGHLYKLICKMITKSRFSTGLDFSTGNYLSGTAVYSHNVVQRFKISYLA